MRRSSQHLQCHGGPRSRIAQGKTRGFGGMPAEGASCYEITRA